MSELAIGQSHRRIRKRSLTPRSGSRGLARWRIRDSDSCLAAPASAPPLGQRERDPHAAALVLVQGRRRDAR